MALKGVVQKMLRSQNGLLKRLSTFGQGVWQMVNVETYLLESLKLNLVFMGTAILGGVTKAATM